MSQDSPGDQSEQSENANSSQTVHPNTTSAGEQNNQFIENQSTDTSQTNPRKQQKQAQQQITNQTNINSNKNTITSQKSNHRPSAILSQHPPTGGTFVIQNISIGNNNSSGNSHYNIQNTPNILNRPNINFMNKTHNQSKDERTYANPKKRDNKNNNGNEKQKQSDDHKNKKKLATLLNQRINNSNVQANDNVAQPASSMIKHSAMPKMTRLPHIDQSQLKFDDVDIYDPVSMGKISWKPKSDVINLDALIKLSLVGMREVTDLYYKLSCAQNNNEQLGFQLDIDKNFRKILGIIKYLNEKQNHSQTDQSNPASRPAPVPNENQTLDDLLRGEVYMDEVEADVDPEYDDLHQRQFNFGEINQQHDEDYLSMLSQKIVKLGRNINQTLPNSWNECKLTLQQLQEIPKSTLIRMNRLAASNQPGDAVDKMYKEVQGKRILKPSEDTHSKLQDIYKFNVNQQSINIQYDEETIKYIENKFTKQKLRKVIMSLRREAAPGPSGWAPDTFKKMIRRNQLFLQSLYSMLYSMMVNRFYPPSFFISSSIALDRGASKDPRPIEVAEVWSRIMSKMINYIEKHAYKNFIPQSQKGTGDKRGGESIGVMVSAAVDLSVLIDSADEQDDTIIVQTDIKGAFPSVQWQQLAETLQRAQMTSMGLDYNIQKLQNQKIYHFIKNRAIIIKSNQGIPQGDPMSPNNFSVMTSDLINKVCAKKNEIIEQQPQTREPNITDSFPAVSAYMDDMVFIARGTQQMASLLNVAKEELSKINMEFQWDKCVALRARKGKIIKDDHAITINDGKSIQFAEKMKLLGMIVSCNPRDRDDDFDKRAKEAVKVGEICSLLFIQNGLHCYRTCVASKLGRSVQTQEISPENIRTFDNVSQKQLLSILEAPPDAEHRLTSIPIKDGGFGVIRLSETRHAALQNTYNYICSNEPMKSILLNAGLEDLKNDKQIHQLATKLLDNGASALKTFLCRILYDRNVGHTDIPEKKGQHEIWTKDMTDELVEFENYLNTHKRFSQLRKYRSHKGDISGGWLCAIGGNIETRLNNQEMRHAVALWLLSDEANQFLQINVSQYCPSAIKIVEQKKKYQCLSCGKEWNQMHYTCCALTTAVRSGRHHQAKNSLTNQFKCLRRVTVVEEQREYIKQNNIEKEIIPDIIVMIAMHSTQTFQFENDVLGGLKNRFEHNMIKFGIDLTIVEEAKQQKTLKTPQQLVDDVEKKKIEKYKDFPEQVNYHVIPFGITSGGTFGKYAQAIVKFIGDLQSFMKVEITTSELKKELSVILIRSGVYQFEFYEKCIRQIAEKKYREQVKTSTLLKLKNSFIFGSDGELDQYFMLQQNNNSSQQVLHQNSDDQLQQPQQTQQSSNENGTQQYNNYDSYLNSTKSIMTLDNDAILQQLKQSIDEQQSIQDNLAEHQAINNNSEMQKDIIDNQFNSMSQLNQAAAKQIKQNILQTDNQLQQQQHTQQHSILQSNEQPQLQIFDHNPQVSHFQNQNQVDLLEDSSDNLLHPPPPSQNSNSAIQNYESNGQQMSMDSIINSILNYQQYEDFITAYPQFSTQSFCNDKSSSIAPTQNSSLTQKHLQDQNLASDLSQSSQDSSTEIDNQEQSKNKQQQIALLNQNNSDQQQTQMDKDIIDDQQETISNEQENLQIQNNVSNQYINQNLIQNSSTQIINNNVMQNIVNQSIQSVSNTQIINITIEQQPSNEPSTTKEQNEQANKTLSIPRTQSKRYKRNKNKARSISLDDDDNDDESTTQVSQKIGTSVNYPITIDQNSQSDSTQTSNANNQENNQSDNTQTSSANNQENNQSDNTHALIANNQENNQSDNTHASSANNQENNQSDSTQTSNANIQSQQNEQPLDDQPNATLTSVSSIVNNQENINEQQNLTNSQEPTPSKYPTVYKVALDSLLRFSCPPPPTYWNLNRKQKQTKPAMEPDTDDSSENESEDSDVQIKQFRKAPFKPIPADRQKRQHIDEGNDDSQDEDPATQN